MKKASGRGSFFASTQGALFGTATIFVGTHLAPRCRPISRYSSSLLKHSLKRTVVAFAFWEAKCLILDPLLSRPIFRLSHGFL